MAEITGLTRGGTIWVPQFITALAAERCIGCGRCYKVCTRDCFELVEREDTGDYEYDDDGFDDDTSMVMRLANALDCIGCMACSRVCPKNCHSHSPAQLGT